MTRLPGPSVETLNRLLAMARDLLQAPDAHSVLKLAGPAIRDLLMTDGALLLVLSGDHEYVTEFDGEGQMRPVREGKILYRHARRAIADQTPIVMPQIETEMRLGGDALVGDVQASLLAIPFPPLDPICAMAAFWYRRGRPHQLTRWVSTMRHVGELTAAALGNIGLRQLLEHRIDAHTAQIEATVREHSQELHRRDQVEAELQRISVTDVLTGMLNRRGFLLHAEQNLRVARRQKMSGTVIFADLDGLKKVNDRYGHDIGDRLIQDGARVFRESFRECDVVGRLGGDEFAAFTIDMANPDVILERMRAATEALTKRSSSPYKLSFSTGIVACDPFSELGLSDYLAIADRRMYEHKKTRPR